MQRIFAAAVMLLVLGVALTARAQQSVPSYRPSSPTLSPYLYLTRPQSGPFPNYQTFVQPLQNQYQTNQMAQQQIIQLQKQQQDLQLTQQQQFAPNLAPTGIGSTYNSLSHFYGGTAAYSSGAAPSPRGAKPGRR